MVKHLLTYNSDWLVAGYISLAVLSFTVGTSVSSFLISPPLLHFPWNLVHKAPPNLLVAGQLKSTMFLWLYRRSCHSYAEIMNRQLRSFWECGRQWSSLKSLLQHTSLRCYQYVVSMAALECRDINLTLTCTHIQPRIIQLEIRSITNTVYMRAAMCINYRHSWCITHQ